VTGRGEESGVRSAGRLRKEGGKSWRVAGRKVFEEKRGRCRTVRGENFGGISNSVNGIKVQKTGEGLVLIQPHTIGTYGKRGHGRGKGENYECHSMGGSQERKSWSPPPKRGPGNDSQGSVRKKKREKGGEDRK